MHGFANLFCFFVIHFKNKSLFSWRLHSNCFSSASIFPITRCEVKKYQLKFNCWIHITLSPSFSPFQLICFLFLISCTHKFHFNYFDMSLKYVRTIMNSIECDWNGNWLKIHHKCLNVKQKRTLNTNIECILCAHETSVFSIWIENLKKPTKFIDDATTVTTVLRHERLDYQTHRILNRIDTNGTQLKWLETRNFETLF